MSKVRPLAPRAVAAARRVLAECDVRHPRDIRVEVIAARYGAMVLYGPLSTATGVVVRTSKRAIIQVAESARGQPRAAFTGAHELGHHLLHDLVDHFAQCHGRNAGPAPATPEARLARGRAIVVEREADCFSAELLMPEALAAPFCDVPRPTLDDVHRLARAFRTSLHASALRFVELTAAPCAFVVSAGGRIERSTETAAFPGKIVARRAIHPASAAARAQASFPLADAAPCVVPGAAWGDPKGPGFVEEAVALGRGLGVLSWIVPAA